MLTGVAELSSPDAPIDLRFVHPLWMLLRRCYVIDPKHRTAKASVFLRVFTRFFFVIEDKAREMGEMHSIFTVKRTIRLDLN